MVGVRPLCFPQCYDTVAWVSSCQQFSFQFFGIVTQTKHQAELGFSEKEPQETTAAGFYKMNALKSRLRSLLN